jgi:hypothetical protein
MVAKLKVERFRPSLAFFVYSIRSVLIDVEPVESAARQPIFTSVLRLKYFDQTMCSREEGANGGSLFLLTVSRPISLLVAVPIVFMIREVPIPCQQSEGFVLRRDVASNTSNVVESVFTRAGRHIDVGHVEIAMIALYMQSGGSTRGYDLPVVMFEQLEESVNHQDDDATLPFVGFHALAGQISIRSSGAVRPPGSEPFRGVPCSFDALGRKGFLHADNLVALGELLDQASLAPELVLVLTTK